MSHIVLITGGTTGIGAVTAKAFKKKGYTVTVNYAHNEEVASQFHAKTQIPIYKWDVSDSEACLKGVQKITSVIGAPEVLVNNAGIVRDHTLHKMTVKEWKDDINTDLGSCFNMCRAVIGSMKDSQFGRIVNISSVSDLSGQFGQTNYAAAKAGIIGFTKSLALENARKGITVNAVTPGYTDTHMLDNIPKKILQNIFKKIPIGRLAHPDEIARAILFLAEDEAGYITGETLAVNGGLYMQ